MEMILHAIPFVTGCYLIILALWLDTQNFKSALIFKIIPFFLGLGCLFHSAKLFGWF